MLLNIQLRLLLTPLLPTGVFRWDVLCYFLLQFILGHSVKDILSCSLRRLNTLKPPDTAGLCQRDKSRLKKKRWMKNNMKSFTDLLAFFLKRKTNSNLMHYCWFMQSWLAEKPNVSCIEPSSMLFASFPVILIAILWKQSRCATV